MQSFSHALDVVDQLLQRIPSEADTLLDLRLSLAKQTAAGDCIEAYFRLKKHLSGWHLKELEKLREMLEAHIQIEIVVQETQERSQRCLGLLQNNDLSDYCQEQMRQACLAHKEAKRILMGFSWNATALEKSAR